jgi:hypothetical protein
MAGAGAAAGAAAVGVAASIAGMHVDVTDGDSGSITAEEVEADADADDGADIADGVNSGMKQHMQYPYPFPPLSAATATATSAVHKTNILFSEPIPQTHNQNQKKLFFPLLVPSTPRMDPVASPVDEVAGDVSLLPASLFTLQYEHNEEKYDDGDTDGDTDAQSHMNHQRTSKKGTFLPSSSSSSSLSSLPATASSLPQSAMKRRRRRSGNNVPVQHRNNTGICTGTGTGIENCRFYEQNNTRSGTVSSTKSDMFPPL